MGYMYCMIGPLRVRWISEAAWELFRGMNLRLRINDYNSSNNFNSPITHREPLKWYCLFA